MVVLLLIVDWTLSVDTPPTWDNGMIKMQSDGATFSRAYQSFNTVSGKVYSFAFEKLINNNQVAIKIGTSQGDSSLLKFNTYRCTNIFLFLYCYIKYIFKAEDYRNDRCILSVFSVKEVRQR